MVASRHHTPPMPASFDDLWRHASGRDRSPPEPNHTNNDMHDRNPFLSKPAFIAYAALALLLVLWLVSPWKRVITDAGTQTVVVDTPMFFGQGGMRAEPLQPGSTWIWKTTKTYVVDPKPMVVAVPIDDFVSQDNILLDFESTVTLRVTNWPDMIQRFGAEWWKNNLHRPYVTAVRTQVKQNSMSGLMSNIDVSARVDAALTKALEDKVKELGMPAQVIDINLGKAKPNQTILAQMDATATQQQRLLTLEQSRLAEVKRAEEQKAKADADNAYRNQIGLNVNEFVQLQLADKQIQACKGAQQCIILPPGTPTVVGR